MKIQIAEERNLFLILKRSIIDIYNHLGYSILISILWLLFAYPFGVLINTGLTIFMENLQKEWK